MIEPSSPAPQPDSQINRELHWPSILTAGGGIVAILVLLGGIGTFISSGLLSLRDPISVENGEPWIMFSYAAAAALISLLVIPTVILAFRRLAGQPPTQGILNPQIKANHASLLLLIYLLVLAGGYFVDKLPQFYWLTLPAMNILALGLPVVLLLWLGTRDLPPSSPQRNWTTFSLGITFNPVVITVIELAAIFFGLVLLITIMVISIPDFPARVEEFTLMMENARATMRFPEEEIIRLIQSPIVVGSLLFFTAGIVPLVEEAIKPAGVWLLSGRELTPRDGWVLGLLSGAGFALVENLGNLAAGEGWTFLAIARGGATALHMFNTAIIGYTFVLSRRQKKWRLVILTFLGTLLLHALWNITAVLATVSTLSSSTASASWPIGYLVILGLTSVATTWGIHRVNRKLAAEAEIHLESEN
jgi:RsiW-degrading membrane proteinase PrsW (M82 family)